MEEIKKLAEMQIELAKQAYTIYLPLVESIIGSKTNDNNHIEHTLDYLLDFCYDKQMTSLYKKLCRYYWDINPQATADYIGFYKEMWDSDMKKKINQTSLSSTISFQTTDPFRSSE